MQLGTMQHSSRAIDLLCASFQGHAFHVSWHVSHFTCHMSRPCRGLMSQLGAQLLAQSQRMQAQLSKFVSRLMARPKDLPGFIAYVDENWPHVDPTGGTKAC